jgi:hypothetical protein
VVDPAWFNDPPSAIEANNRAEGSRNAAAHPRSGVTLGTMISFLPMLSAVRRAEALATVR